MNNISFKLLLLSLYLSFLHAETQIETFLTEINIQHVESGIDNINCVYVINLENRPKKWLTTQEGLATYEIYPNRVPAINGWMLSELEKQILSGPYPIRLRGGQFGCLLSHLSTIHHALKKGFDIIWVCEDDIQLCENPHQIRDLISDLSIIDPEWDILYTDLDSKNSEGTVVPATGYDFRPDYPHEELSYYLNREYIHEEIVKIGQRYGTYSMIITKKGMEKIFNYFRNRYLWAAYDIDLHYIPGIREYCINRDLVSINYSYPSDTRDKH